MSDLDPESPKPESKDPSRFDELVVLAGQISEQLPPKLMFSRLAACKEIEYGLLKVEDASGSSFLAIENGDTVIGALSSSGHVGIMAVRQIMSLRSGSFSYYDLGQPALALNQEMVLALDSLLPNPSATVTSIPLPKMDGKAADKPPPLKPAVKEELDVAPAPVADTEAKRRQVEEDLERALLRARINMPPQAAVQTLVEPVPATGTLATSLRRRARDSGDLRDSSDNTASTASARALAARTDSEPVGSSYGEGKLAALIGAAVLILLSLLTVSTLSSYSAGIQFRSALSCLKNGETATAVAQLTSCLRADPQLTQAYFYRALALSREGETERAIADWNTVLKKDGKNVDAYLGRAAQYLRKHDYQNAIADCDSALKLSSSSLDALRLRAIAKIKIEDFEGAQRDCLAYLHSSCATTSKESLCDVWGMLGLIESHNKRFAEAVSDYTHGLAACKKAGLLSGRARCYADLHDWKKALSDCDLALALEPSLKLQCLKARCLAGLGQYAQCLRELKTAIAISPVDPEPYRQRAHIEMERRDFALAYNDYQSVLDRLQGDPEATSGLKRARAALPHLVASMPETSAGSHSEPQLPPVSGSCDQLVSLGYAQLARGAAEQAIATLTAAVQANPNDVAARRYLAHAFAAAHHPRQAVEQFAAVATMSQLGPEDILCAARALCEEGRTAEALKKYDDYLGWRPGDVVARLEAMDICEKRGERERALALGTEGLSRTIDLKDRQLLDSRVLRLKQPPAASARNRAGES